MGNGDPCLHFAYVHIYIHMYVYKFLFILYLSAWTAFGCSFSSASKRVTSAALITCPVAIRTQPTASNCISYVGIVVAICPLVSQEWWQQQDSGNRKETQRLLVFGRTWQFHDCILRLDGFLWQQSLVGARRTCQWTPTGRKKLGWQGPRSAKLELPAMPVEPDEAASQLHLGSDQPAT